MSKENYNIDVFIIKPNNLNIIDFNDLKEKVDKVIQKETLTITNEQNNNLINLVILCLSL